jgi:hypothetical protein
MLEIVEAYRDFAPPCNARAAVEDLLASVPLKYLGGLSRIVLTNTAALTGQRRRGWSWSRGRKARYGHVAGLYHHRSRADPAWIELFVDRIVEGVPVWALRFRLARLLFGSVLYHELGHHIQAQHRPEHREVEDVADEWKDRLGRNHVRQRHPIARVLLWVPARLGLRIMRWRREAGRSGL